ncbi:protein-lysine N-methyltransferase EEF2KMT isoform X2 [Piliocolobus tephrosceles]|uniref:protein-lysine N-methyltransferase EEF2KMT isoform X2 n=1 Tax=Piliocolobus tephrosceles TaxID=591936 RepID=UPI000C2ABD21|nr:protein-lysine N-methyltransferase EEF2KMT isoform X2 [Piliocolobus tephrosceles]
MAPEEDAGTELLLQSFERRFLAARALRSFPWQSLEAKLRDSSDSELLRDILQKHEAVHTEPLDELYEALAETLMAKESTQGHRSYLLTDSLALSRRSPREARSRSPRAPPSSPTAPRAWSRGTLPSTLQNGPSRTRRPSLTGDLGAQGGAPRQAYPGAVADMVRFPSARTVLELGSGAGLTGLAICKMCRPRAYIFSDCHSRVLEQLRGNVLLNGLSLEADITANLDSPRVTVAQLDWDVTTVHQLSAFQPDVVIAADVLYCPEAIMSLVGVLRRLAACREHQRAPEVYVAFTVRNPDTCQLFTTELGRAGITWEAEPRHDQKLFPYEEHLEMAILNLTM